MKKIRVMQITRYFAYLFSMLLVVSCEYGQIEIEPPDFYVYVENHLENVANIEATVYLDPDSKHCFTSMVFMEPVRSSSDAVKSLEVGKVYDVHILGEFLEVRDFERIYLEFSYTTMSGEKIPIYFDDGMTSISRKEWLNGAVLQFSVEQQPVVSRVVLN